jgi:hypothetical protein
MSTTLIRGFVSSKRSVVVRCVLPPALTTAAPATTTEQAAAGISTRSMVPPVACCALSRSSAPAVLVRPTLMRTCVRAYGEALMTDGRKALEQLGDEIAELAAHIHAATCRWLKLLAEFDAREGWAAWGCRSCAHWVAWRCSMAPSAAREHVRVARRLAELPLIAAAFERGELSYSKVRALTRVEGVCREEELLELARCSTAAQLERIVRGYRRVTAATALRAHDDRFLRVTHVDDGSVVLHGRLSREEGALVMKALEVMRSEAVTGASREAPACGDTDPGASAEALRADALVAMADAALAAPAGTGRTGGDRYQVVVHVDTDALGGDDGPGAATVEDEAPLARETVRRLCCDASIVSVLERDGTPLSVGRKTRSIPPALRRALRSRDGGCRFPGCNQRRHVDGHHIHHWAHGGPTELSNLVQLCRHHHRLVHEAGTASNAAAVTSSSSVARTGGASRPSPGRRAESRRRCGPSTVAPGCGSAPRPASPTGTETRSTSAPPSTPCWRSRRRVRPGRSRRWRRRPPFLIASVAGRFRGSGNGTRENRARTGTACGMATRQAAPQGLSARERLFLALVAAATVAAGVAHFADAPAVLAFALATVALAGLAWIVSFSTEQVGERFGPGVTGLLQSTLGNLPELFVVLFALGPGRPWSPRRRSSARSSRTRCSCSARDRGRGPALEDLCMTFSRRLPNDTATLLLSARS